MHLKMSPAKLLFSLSFPKCYAINLQKRVHLQQNSYQNLSYIYPEFCVIKIPYEM